MLPHYANASFGVECFAPFAYAHSQPLIIIEIDLIEMGIGIDIKNE